MITTLNLTLKNSRIHAVPAALGLAVLILSGCAKPAEEITETTETDAREVVEIPVTTSSDTALALFDEGQYLLDVGRGVEARERFQAAIAEDPDFAYAYFNASNASLSFAEFKETLDAAMEHMEGKSEGERLLVEINQTFLDNNSDQGLKLAKQLVEKYPDSPRAWQALAGIQATRNEDKSARKSLEKALALDPESAAAVLALGNSYLFSEPKDFARAEQSMKQLIALYPNEAKAYEGLGDVMRAENDLDAALAAYTQATDTDPTLAAAQVKNGHVNSFLGNIEEARAAYDAAIESGSPEAKATFANYRAFTHIHAGDVQGSIDELAELADSVAEMGTPADQVKGIQVFTLTNEATAALHSGNLKQAAKAIAMRNELVREIGKDVGTEDAARLQEADCLIWDGLLAAYQGDYELAMAKAEQNVELLADDENPRKMESYHWVLGMAYLGQDDYGKAVEHLRRADYKNTMYIRYQLALAEAGVGNTGEARKLFKQVADWNFNSVGYALVHEDAAERATG